MATVDGCAGPTCAVLGQVSYGTIESSVLVSVFPQLQLAAPLTLNTPVSQLPQTDVARHSKSPGFALAPGTSVCVVFSGGPIPWSIDDVQQVETASRAV